MVSFVQFKPEKHPWRSDSFSTKSNTPQWYFSRFLHCTNGTESRNASHIENWYFSGKYRQTSKKGESCFFLKTFELNIRVSLRYFEFICLRFWHFSMKLKIFKKLFCKT